MAADAIANHSPAWWDFETETPPASWRESETPILTGLIEHVPGSTDLRPWQAGYELHIQGLGGVVSKERRRYTILGHGTYSNHIGGCRSLIANRQDIQSSREIQTSIGRIQDGPDIDIPWGRDSLEVIGDATINVGARMLMMSGVVTRNWNGGVVRVASMEGVICGGAFLRLIAGPAATLSPLMSSDVYGGCARTAAVRTSLAVLYYRAASSAAWLSGLYVRNATFVIEPIVGSPSAGTPQSRLAAKMARLGRALSVARMVFPVLDIFIGLTTAVPMGLYALGRLISGIVKKPNAIPPTGPPRVRNRSAGVGIATYGSQVCT